MSDHPSESSGLKCGVLWASGISALLMVLGYYFVVSEPTTLGSTIFIAVPFVAGLTIGLLVNNIKHIALSGLGGCVFAMSFLIVMGMEGIFCALMAAPLAMAAMIVAGLLVHVADHFQGQFNSGKHLAILLLFSHCSSLGSTRLRNRACQPGRVTISTASASRPRPTGSGRRLAVRSMDGAKPFLLQPARCRAAPLHARGGGRGSVRTCYFDKGIIMQEVTAWQKPSRMEFEIMTPCRETNG